MIRQETAWVLFAAGVIFLAALFLGVWKWQQSMSSPDGTAHRYVNVAHNSALLYSFATSAVVAPLVQFSGWPSAVNIIAAAAVVGMFVVTIANYVRLGIEGRTDNQMRDRKTSLRGVRETLIIGEIGGTAVLLTGFASAQL
ncbi:hypothetical protein ACN6LC_006011 [Streptomyces violaceoruber]|uniref:Integral membrane protein n=5 Tax=Streptomyces TaxID=1883 RepID=Q93RT0_STRCO|nr:MULTISPECIES: hypothetical protein [Streptomyces]QSJ07842.1 hypothetical protein SLIVDG2_06595 [Streptomyces lividans]AIJ12334.1 hypothetical protein SLIV_06595 [Streptomyces lividans TK24]EFD65681.1 integral membrane protein [Streptomyces lividans TK24]EOY51408.1 hypothetical protein SLI_6702 [Streptomyces lividans 1326]KKD11391.1 membrane protein [Streptomyces sp. WM6391]